MELKKCNTCQEEKSVELFKKGKNLCKKCHNIYEKIRREKTKFNYSNVDLNSEKECSECKEIKPLKSFHRRSDSPDGFRGKCRDCINKKDREYRKENEIGKKEYAKNREKSLEKSKEYYQKNREKRKAASKKYYAENKEVLLKKAAVRQSKRLKTDVNYKITRNLRNRLYYALKNNTKYKPTLELLGCSIEELKSHLEAKFTEGMTWDNYGEWHIDHIKPCASFDLTIEDDQKLCFHYENLQPLWATDNIKKGTN